MLIYNFVVVFGGVVEKRKHNEGKKDGFSEGNSGIIIILKWRHGKMWLLCCGVLHFLCCY